MISSIVWFLLVMWALIIAGGGIVTRVLGPISVSGYGELDAVIGSGLKAAAALGLVVAWVLVLARLKAWIFRRELEP